MSKPGVLLSSGKSLVDVLRGGVVTRNSASHERPRMERIEIPVPAIISEETFALAQELLTANKLHAPRRTIEPSICQGMVSRSKCGYALSRSSTRSSARKIHYFRRLGSDTTSTGRHDSRDAVFTFINEPFAAATALAYAAAFLVTGFVLLIDILARFVLRRQRV
jgi:hypothetical protein